MRTVWDRKNKRWVNVPQSWVDADDFDELFSLEKPEEEGAGESEKVPESSTESTPESTPEGDVPVKATTKGRKNA